MDIGLLKKQLKQHEGLRLKPYRDSVGKLTIGFGRNLDDRGISADEADVFLSNDVRQVLRSNSPNSQDPDDRQVKQEMSRRRVLGLPGLKTSTGSTGQHMIGYGRDLSGSGITETEADNLLENDIKIVEGEIQNQLPWFNALDDTRQRVVANMVFNLGMPKFEGFRNMIGALSGKNKDYNRAASEMLNSKWAKQVGRRATDLADMMRKGDPKP